MKKGFTLAELLGVIVILSILILVCFPAVTKVINKGKETAYKAQIEDIEKAASDWGLLHSDLLPEKDSSLTIKLGVLKQEGLIEKDIKNVKTGKYLSNESTIKISYIKGSYVYDINLVDVKLNQATEDGPIMILKGDVLEYFEVNQNGLKYTDHGCTAIDSEKNPLAVSTTIYDDSDNVVASINEKQMGTYKILYESSDSDNNNSSITRTVVVNDTTQPEMTVHKLTTTLELFNISMLDSGVAANDNSGEAITPTYEEQEINGRGTYYVTYTATDSSGNSISKRRTVVIN